MAFTTPRTWVSGELITAALMNTFVRDNQNAMTAGYMGIASQAANDVLYASSATQLARLAAGTSGEILTTKGSGSAPEWEEDIDVAGKIETDSTQNALGGDYTAPYTANTALLVKAGTNSRVHFRTGLSLAGSPATGYGLQFVDDANPASNVDLWLWPDDLYVQGTIKLRAGKEFKVATAGAPTVFDGGSAGQVLTSGGAGVSPTWETP
jgi:hypothetical protein